MPKNNELRQVKLPMVKKFDKLPKTGFVNNLDSIIVELINYPTMAQLRSYLPQFVLATWAESPWSNELLNAWERDKVIREALEGKALPTALETIRLTFKISGISIQEVTHLLRHRMASFSADCSGDKWWTDKEALIPNSIQNSNGSYYGGQEQFNRESRDKKDFHARYEQIVQMSKQLYCDMIDSRKVSIMDARYILPRCLGTFYYMSLSVKDALEFIRQRIDKQIQPETDNIIAYQMYLQMVQHIPIMHSLVDFISPSQFYIKMARTGKATNLYFPDSESDKFEWNEDDFIYQCERSEMNGTDDKATNHFLSLYKMYNSCLDRFNQDAINKLNADYEESEV